MSWLPDTCVLSEYLKKSPAPQVITWLDEQDETSLHLSVITLGEIEKSILKLRATDPRRSQKLTAWLGKVEQRFAGRILPLDFAALHTWAQFAAQSELSCRPLPVMDGLIMNEMAVKVLPEPVAIWIRARGRFSFRECSRFWMAWTWAGQRPSVLSAGMDWRLPSKVPVLASAASKPSPPAPLPLAGEGRLHAERSAST